MSEDMPSLRIVLQDTKDRPTLVEFLDEFYIKPSAIEGATVEFAVTGFSEHRMRNLLQRSSIQMKSVRWIEDEFDRD